MPGYSLPITVALALPADLLERLDGLAQRNHRTSSEETIIALERYLDDPERLPAVPAVDPLAPTHLLSLISPIVPAVLVTAENIEAIADALDGSEFFRGEHPMIRVKLPAGMIHELEVGDYFIMFGDGLWPIPREDVGPLFTATER